ncbi:hypothetical protein M1N10_05300 [Thermodesulfovibrionales bacterium]|nr:hypothetical protein [Thermodesulfovibrionales bacterium]
MRFLGFKIRLVRSRRKFALMYPSKKAVKGLYARVRAIANSRMPVATYTQSNLLGGGEKWLANFQVRNGQ